MWICMYIYDRETPVDTHTQRIWNVTDVAAQTIGIDCKCWWFVWFKREYIIIDPQHSNANISSAGRNVIAAQNDGIYDTKSIQARRKRSIFEMVNAGHWAVGTRCLSEHASHVLIHHSKNCAIVVMNISCTTCESALYVVWSFRSCILHPMLECVRCACEVLLSTRWKCSTIVPDVMSRYFVHAHFHLRDGKWIHIWNRITQKNGIASASDLMHFISASVSALIVNIEQ